MASTVKWYVDPDVVAGDGSGDSWVNAYASLAAFEAAEGKDISTGTGSDEIYRVNCRSLSGSDDEVTFEWNGHTTDSTGYVIVTGDSADGGDFPASTGIFDDSKYVFHNNDSASYGIENRTENCYFDQIQFKATETAANFRVVLSYISSPANTIVFISNCIFKGVVSGTGTSYGIELNDGDITATIYNTSVYDFFIAADGGFRGINVGNCNTADIYNCTINNCTFGIVQNSGTVTAINCLVFECTDDFVGTIAMTYSASDDDHTGDSATNFVITQSADDYAALVTDANGGDYSVTDASSELYQTGNGATPKGTFTDDIIGTTRGPADLDWDIGAFELVVAVGAAGIMTPNAGIWGPTF